jgi:aldehyde dehydrogenase (NAD+)
MSSNRIIVDAKVHDEFVERFAAHLRTLKAGNPAEPDTVIAQSSTMDNWRE